jgi:hypothetical protein
MGEPCSREQGASRHRVLDLARPRGWSAFSLLRVCRRPGSVAPTRFLDVANARLGSAPADRHQSRPIRASTAVITSWRSRGRRGKGSERRGRRGYWVRNRPQGYCTAHSTKQGGMTGPIRIELSKLEERRLSREQATVFPQKLCVTGLVRIKTVWVRNGCRRLRPCEPEGTEHHGRDDCNETHVEP